jgi:hypothetical protein
MASLREKLMNGAAPYLEPGEQIQAIFPVRSGPSPYWAILTYWIVIFQGGFRTVVATDRAILILKNGWWSAASFRGVHLRGARNVWLGTPSGLWGKIQLDTRYWVHKRFHKDVAQVDAALRAMGGATPSGPGDFPQQYAN